MLDMDQILSFYPDHLRPFRRNILREYLQYKILEAIFSSGESGRLAFLGGTAIHIIHGNPRFSEDLDFDDRGMSAEDFGRLSDTIRRTLEREGLNVELDTPVGGRCRANLRFIGILQKFGITGHREEKLHIHLDAEPQEFEYKPDQVLLNKFDVFCRINAVPVDILLSQKIGCILQRPRPIGRDFYDALFLWGKTDPNAGYLTRKLGIINEAALWDKLEARCASIDFTRLTRDLLPFVTDSTDAEKIEFFREFIARKRDA
ncbi:MAG: nucleotidyl transferase AbiEii/AbiGii toxin family protein [Chitinispirillaceae bacterium]|nr:nucleotidyl transferase AbiEii/AbiGii toxin family protein [Chitinispirillaceae bacterium]